MGRGWHAGGGTRSRGWLVGLLLVVVAGMSAPSAFAGAADYSYDDAGRLATVANSDGAAAYRWDEVGNLVAIERFSAGTAAVLNLSPRRVVPGGTVRIIG